MEKCFAFCYEHEIPFRKNDGCKGGAVWTGTACGDLEWAMQASPRTAHRQLQEQLRPAPYTGATSRRLTATNKTSSV
jgi:hypothetical protein